MNQKQNFSLNSFRVLISMGALAAVTTTIACSGPSKPSAKEESPIAAKVQPAVLQLNGDNMPQAPTNISLKESVPVKATAPKPVTYKSRDYGISFVYPWQYAYMSARTIANGDNAYQPKSDGYEGQFPLARVDIPKGYYPDTDFESGYFTVSLNQELSEDECKAVPAPGNGGKVESESINGLPFQWVEADKGGRGDWSKVRTYVTYANDTCYELELGVKTSNDQGLAREVNADHVLQRLDSILQTVKIDADFGKPANQQLENSNNPAPTVAKN